MAVRFDADGEGYTRATGLGAVTVWSFSCWVNLAVDSATTTVLLQIDNGSGTSRLRINAWNGTALTHQTDGGGWFGTIGHSLSVGAWSYVGISGTSNPGEVRTAARSAGSTTWAGGTSAQSNVTFNANTLRIGDGQAASEWLNGSMAAVKIWDQALSVEELRQESWTYIPQRTTGLRGWYPLLTNSTVDYSGLSQTLTGGTGAALVDGPPITWGAGRRRIVIPYVAPPVIPTYQSSSSVASGTSGAFNCPKPTSPNPVVEGDTLVAFHAADVGTLAEMGTPTGGATWSLLVSRSRDDGTGSGSKVWWKVAGASEPANYGFTQGSGADGSVSIVAVHNGDQSTPVIAATGGTGSSTTKATPSTTAQVDDFEIRCVALHAPGGARTFTAPVGLTERTDIQSSTFALTTTATRSITSAGSTGIHDFTANTATTEWHGFTVNIAAPVTPITVVIGQAIETDTSTAFTSRKIWTASQSTETDSVFGLVRRKEADASQAVETDTALALSSRKIMVLGQAAETDSSHVASAQRSYSIAQSNETDTAFGLTFQNIVSIVQAAETDTAFGFTWTKVGTIGQAVENDSSLGFLSSKNLLISQAAEADSALTMTEPTINVALNQAVETDSTFGLTWARRQSLSQATETDSAQSFQPLKRKEVAQSIESDSAQDLSAQRGYALSQATESDSATAFGSASLLSIGQAVETDSATALSIRKLLGIVQSTETDSAQNILATSIGQIGIAEETDSAHPLGSSKAAQIGFASETDSAQALSSVKNKSIAQSSEADSSQAIVAAKSVQISTAMETDAPFSFAPVRVYAMGISSEADLSQSVTPARLYSISRASETDSSFVLTWTKFKSIGVVIENDSAHTAYRFLGVDNTFDGDASVTLFTGAADVVDWDDFVIFG